MGSICSTIYDNIPDPSEGQFMWQPKNGKKITYYSKRQEKLRKKEEYEKNKKFIKKYNK